MTDILLDTDLDLEFANGDFVTGESTTQHQELLLISAKGDFKEYPTACVGAGGYLKDEDVSALLGEAKQEFEKDGMKVNSILFDNDKLLIDAHY
jgi:hypothetical protein